MYPLNIRTNPQGWRHFIARRARDNFKQFAQPVWERDQLMCQYCGIVSNDFQEVINLDGDYFHNTLDNLVTACGLCAQCGFLESIGVQSYGGGTLIYLPELSQAHLNGLCYALFKAILFSWEEQETAQQYYQSLQARSQLIEDELGDGMSDPAVFGQLLVESNLKIQSNTFASKVRLLPNRVSFKEMIMQGVITENLNVSHSLA